MQRFRHVPAENTPTAPERPRLAAAAAVSPEPPPVPDGVPGLPTPTLTLSFPREGLRDGALLVCSPRAEDVVVLAAAFADPDLRDAGNLPQLGPDELLATLPHLPALAGASGRLAPVVVVDETRGTVVGGGALHHLDPEREILEIGYWVSPHARRRGVATRGADPHRVRAAGRPAGRGLRQRRQSCVRARARARRLHARGRRALAADPERAANR